MYPLGPGVARAANPEPRYFVMLYHDLMRGDGQTMGVHTRRVVASMQSRQWIEKALQPGDYVAVLTYDSRLHVRQDFTRDREALAGVLERMILRGDSDEDGEAPLRSESRRAALRRDALRPLDAGPAVGDPDTPASILSFLPAGDELREASTSLGRALYTLARALRPIEGRKHLLFYTIGVGVVPGENLVGMLNRSNVDVYTIDLTPPQAQHLQSVALRAMARDTDGEYYPNGSSFLQTLRHIERRANDYYQLAYLRGEDGEPERVEVRAKDPKLRVTSRRRFAN